MRRLLSATLGVATCLLATGAPLVVKPSPPLELVGSRASCKPRAPLTIAAIDADIEGPRVELGLEVTSQVAVRDVRVELQLPDGALSRGATSVALGSISPRATTPARLSYSAPGGPGHTLEVLVEGRLTTTGERIASTRTLTFGEPITPVLGPLVETRGSIEQALARSIDAPARRLVGGSPGSLSGEEAQR